MEKVTSHGEVKGISLEQMARYGKFDTRVKRSYDQYGILYTIEGERLSFLNNREYVAHSGDLVPMDTNLIHMTRSVTTEDTDHSRVTLYVNYDRMKAFDGQYPSLQLVRFLRGHYGTYHLDKEQQALFLGLCRNLHTATTEKAHNCKVGIGLETLTWLFRITSYVSEQEDANPHSSDHFKYRTTYAIVDYLSGSCEQNISLEESAAHFYLNKYYVCHTFKETTGYTITEYANIHRIRKAKHLLEEINMSISGAAHELGYESLTHFERMLKSFMTISPLKYRKTPNTVTYTNEQTTKFEEDTEWLSSHRQSQIHHNFI